MRESLTDKLKMIMSDPILWIETFCNIVDKNSITVKFKLNKQQRYLLQNVEKYNIVLKSRQLGITSVSCALSLFYAITAPNNTCLLVSYSLDSANAIFDKLKQIYDDLPMAIKPKDIANNRKQLKFENGSTIIVATLGTKSIARGSTIKFCHISEVAFCKSEYLDKQLLAIEQALVPDSVMILESTANGLNSFSDMWDKAEKGDNLYKPFFFNWIDDKVMFAKEYQQFTDRYKQIHGKDLEEEELTPEEGTYLEMGASMEQLTWRRIKIKNSSEEQFKQEFPASPIEAFLTTGANMFDTEKIINRYNVVAKIKSLKDIPNIPALLKPYNRNYLLIWEAPERDIKYTIGVDASEGIGKDYNVIHVYTNDLMQVAEFRSNKTAPHEVAKIVNELGKWYNNALIVVEKASGGHVVLERLRHDYCYKNLYKHKDYDSQGKMIKKVGFNTNAKTKPIIINDFVELWDNNDIYIKSLTLLNEMKVFVYSDTGMRAESGKHDDCVMATALAIQGVKSGVRYK